MTTMKLTEKSVAALRIPAGARDLHVWDEELAGFGLRAFASGAKTYVVKFAVRGQQRKLSLGTALPGTLAQKKKVAADILARARTGEDVVAKKKAGARINATTVGTLVPRYLQQMQSKFRPSTLEDSIRYLERYWQPLHRLPIDGVSRRDVVATLDAIVAEHGALTADRAKASLGAFYAWAIDTGYCDTTPVLHIKARASAGSRERVLSEPELVNVWMTCGELGEFGAIVRLLILTGQRRTEIGDLAWDEIDWDRRQIDLPGLSLREGKPVSRTKNNLPHLVPMSEEAVRILRNQPQWEDRRHLFGTGTRGWQAWSQGKRKLDALLPKEMPHWTLHDIRRSVVTHMNDRGIAQPHIVEAIVNHVSGGAKKGVAGTYNKAQYLDERRRALDVWAQHLLALVEASPRDPKAIRGSFGSRSSLTVV